jgi:Ribbon-helix-helix protein, copG family
MPPPTIRIRSASTMPCSSYHASMRKTTVYLPDALKWRLARAAKRRGESQTALVREAIERLLDEEPHSRPTLPLDGGHPAAPAEE